MPEIVSRETAAAAAGSSLAPVVPAPVVGEPEQAAGTPQANGELVPG